ncbi:MAG: gamma-glutamylcyclotransferase family protein [Acetobacteraceae bacterium]|jgi:hypothetical protein
MDGAATTTELVQLTDDCGSRYSDEMRLFLYGTLLQPATLAARSGDPTLPRRYVPATLHGWRRVALPAVPWPTLRRDPRSVVAGMVVDVSAAAATRLAAYEGDTYRLVPVVVATANGKTAARTFIKPGGTRRPWKG